MVQMIRYRTAVTVAGVATALVLLATVAVTLASRSFADVTTQDGTSSYDRLVLQSKPVAYWRMAHPADGRETDHTGNGRTGYYRNVTTAKSIKLPNGDGAAVFDGVNDYLQVADNNAFSISTTGEFTVELWLRPHTLQFTHDEQGGYVYFIGKGLNSNSGGDREWAGRMYSKVNDENRPNRISGYAWNPDGGYGAGAYFQDPVRVGEFIHYALTFRLDEGQYGKVRIHKNGVHIQTADLVYRPGRPEEVVVVPRNRSAPVRVGTRDGNSFFYGAIAKVAIYNKTLTQQVIRSHYDHMYA